MEIDRHSICSITGGGVLVLGRTGGPWSLSVSQVGGPKKKKRECTPTPIRPEMRLSKKNKLDKGHAFNVGNCVMKSKKREGKASHEQRLS